MFIMIIIASIAILSLTASAGSYTVSMTPDKTTAEPGETVTMEISISNCQPISAAAISFEIDSNIVELTSGEVISDTALIKAFDPKEVLPGMLGWMSATDINGKVVCRAVFTVKAHAVSTDIKCNFQVSYADGSQETASATVSISTCKHTNSTYEKLDATNHNKVCSGCGQKTQEGHKWNNGTVTTEPDHKNPGEKTYTCTSCGETKKEPVDQIAHTFNQKNTDAKYLKTEANCTSAAVYYYSCTCGEKGTTTFTSGSKLGHQCDNYTYDNNATCTQDGTESGPCVRCGEKQTRTKANSKLNHSFTNYVFNNDATCTKDGTETAKCDRCTVKDTRTKTGSMTAHPFDTKWSSNAQGHYHKCTKCSAKDEVIAHIPGPEATETTAQKCTVCNYTIKAALGHKTHVADTSAWLTDGVNHWHKCTGCDEVKLDEAAHTGGTATCKDKATCEICQVTYGEFSGHTYDGDSDLECNICTEKRECSHTFGDWTTTKEPTYDEPGEKERTCSNCGEKETAPIDMLEPTAPPATEVPATDAPSTEAPSTEVPKATQEPTRDDPAGSNTGLIIGIVIAAVVVIAVVVVIVLKRKKA